MLDITIALLLFVMVASTIAFAVVLLRGLLKVVPSAAKALATTEISQAIKDELTSVNPEALLMDGMDKALVGITMENLAVYDYYRIIDVLCETMEEDEAIEYADFNILGAYMGENTPVVVQVGIYGR